MNYLELVLIRGLPGSGKSTLAKSMSDTHVWLEADMYLMEGNKYVFSPERRAEGHRWCLKETTRELQRGLSVVVSNTFTTVSEMIPYSALAMHCGAKLTVIEAKGDFGSVHNVPPEIIEQMRRRWEPYVVE